MKKIACPISCRISPGTTIMRYRKEQDDPYKTAEVKWQRGLANDLDTPFKLSQTGRIMSQASGT